MRRVLLMVMTLVALGQLYFMLRAEIQAVRDLRVTLAKFDGESAEPPAQAYHDLRAIAPRIPEDARVLFVTDSLRPFPIEFYLLPRKISYLHMLDPALLASLEGHATSTEIDGFLERLDWLDRTEQRFTPERLRQRLAECDYVVCSGNPASFGLTTLALDEIARVPPRVTVYRRTVPR
ncbi:MAG: hypothetical protein U1E76_03425 [Planctomycetota bacterium]